MQAKRTFCEFPSLQMKATQHRNRPGGRRQYGAVVGTERSCLKGGFTGFRNPGRGASYRTSNDQSGQTVAESRQSFGIARVSHQGISQECFRPQEPIYCAGVNFGYRRR